MSDEVFRQFQASVARIYNRAGVVVGGGFLVADGYLLTCAHVVAAASGILQSQKEMPTGSLELDFPLDAVQQTRAAERVRATVVVWFPVGYSSMMEDVAVLRLLDSAPGTVLPVSVKAVSDFQDNHPLRIYGFPTGAPEGRWTVPVSRGWNGRGWIQMVNPGVGDYPVEPGYSGSPVWDGSVPGIVGMTVARDIREAVNGSFMIPKKGLLPALRGIEQHSLMELLEPVERDLQPVIKQAYFLCRPEGWKSPNPATLQGILDELIAMPDDQMGYSPVHRFIALLGVQHPQPSIGEGFFSWLRSYCSEAQSLIEWAKQRIRELDQQCATARFYLLIQLQKSIQQSSATQTYYQTNAEYVNSFVSKIKVRE